MPTATCGIGVSHGVGEASALGFAFPVLAGLQGEVASVVERSGDVRVFDEACVELFVLGSPIWMFARGHAIESLLLWRFEIVPSDAMFVRMEPCQNGGEGRAAEWASNIATGKREGLVGELVEVGRFDVGMAHETVVRPGLIVGDDEEHVGPFLGDREKWQEEACEKVDESCCHAREVSQMAA